VSTTLPIGAGTGRLFTAWFNGATSATGAASTGALATGGWPGATFIRSTAWGEDL
jgi:hypothetical protein